MDTQAVREFIRNELNQGKDIDDVKQKLKSIGYSHELIEAASIEYFAEEHMGDIMTKRDGSESEKLTEHIVKNITLTHLTFAIAFIGVAYLVFQNIMKGTLEKAVYLIGFHSLEYLIEGMILYMILSFMQRNYNPQESIELQKVTFLRSISYIILSGIVIDGLKILIPAPNLDLLAVIVFFVIVFVRYIFLMLFFNIFSFLKFTMIAVFFAAVSWAFEKLSAYALTLLPI